MQIFEFQPCQWVIVTFCDVKYRGRVAKCHLGPNDDHTYTVEYVNDAGDMKSGDFRADEIILA